MHNGTFKDAVNCLFVPAKQHPDCIPSVLSIRTLLQPTPCVGVGSRKGEGGGGELSCSGGAEGEGVVL